MWTDTDERTYRAAQEVLKQCLANTDRERARYYWAQVIYLLRRKYG